MSEKLGPVLYGKDSNEVFLGYDLSTQKGYSEHIASVIDEEVKRIIDEAYAKAEKILSEHKKQVEDLAEKLLEKEKISGEEFDAIMEGKTFEASSTYTPFTTNIFADREEYKTENSDESEQSSEENENTSDAEADSQNNN